MRAYLMAACVAVLAVAAPAAAVTYTGTVGSSGQVYIPDIGFDRDGTATVTVSFRSASPFAVDSTSSVQRLNLTFYDFYDPQTGEPLGGDDNFGDYQPISIFGDDGINGQRRSYRFVTDAGNVFTRHDYSLQNPGDPFPFEIGYERTYLLVDALVFGGSAPVDYIVTVDGTAVLPEPATWALLLTGFAGVGMAARRRVTAS